LGTVTTKGGGGEPSQGRHSIFENGTEQAKETSKACEKNGREEEGWNGAEGEQNMEKNRRAYVTSNVLGKGGTGKVGRLNHLSEVEKIAGRRENYNCKRGTTHTKGT